jgi:ferritin-like metal-binding protein YciE
LIQYLNEAYGKEKQLEQALQAHIKMTDVASYKKRLQEHLKETKGHARELQKRIKQLGGKAEAVDLPGPEAVSEAASSVAAVAGKAVAAAQGAVHAVRGTSKQEQQLKNAKDEYHEEAEEIANYTAIQSLADALGDKETIKLAKTILRDEQRMAKFLEGMIPRLAKAVVTAEIPARERKPQTAAASSSRSRSSSSSPSRSRSTASRPASRSRSTAAAKAKSGGGNRSTAAKPKSATTRSTAPKRSSSNGSTAASRSRTGSSGK